MMDRAFKPDASNDLWGTACASIPDLMPCFNTNEACKQTEDMAKMLFDDIDLELLQLNCMSMDADCGMVETNWQISRRPWKRTAMDNCSIAAREGSLASF